MNGLFINGTWIEHGLRAFCWMLIHSLWQGLLLAIIAGIVMLLTRKARAGIRYTLIASLFFAFLVVCGGTYIYEYNSDFAATGPGTTGLGGIILLQQYGINEWPAALGQYCSTHATYIVLGWFAIFSFRCWQMSRAFVYVRRVRTNRHQAPDAYWQNRVNALTQQLHIKRTVTMLESGITKIPVVIGHLKPVIYMPVGLLANLPPDQVEAVLLHELAHIRRNDYLVNLLQSIAETIFFFNPGLLWVSSLLKQEREHCCDDVALAHTGNRKQFIQALISFKEHVLYGSSHAMAFPGKKSHLLQRVARIVYNRNNTLSGGEKIFLLSSLLICFALLGTMAGKHEMPALAVKGPAKEVYETVAPPQQPVTELINAKRKSAATEKRNTTPSGKIKASLPVRDVPVTVNVQNDLLTKTILDRQIETENTTQGEKEHRFEQDRRKAEQDRQQAMREREQAEKDRAQADRDRERADRDRQMAGQHRIQADRDRQQADRDRAQAELDRKQAEKDREQADRDRAQADKDRAHAEEDRRQAGLDRKLLDQKRAQYNRTNTAQHYTNP